ncbi:uncharacterized protein LOC141639908 [Silene latifolia]|uniref:uncharacterized protein LOC141639908 n=1 Tax=Silene latifolia TaxID=37657 RepID=UPI003D77B1CE
MLDKLKVTLPFTEVILNMLTYAKFLKDVLSKKRTLGNQELVALTEDCSAVLMNKMPTKLGDLGNFSIPCIVGNVPISRALCDIGVSVSVLPLNIAKKIGMNEFLPTNIIFQLADRSIKCHMGVLEDVPIKVGDVIEFNLSNLVKKPMLDQACTIEIIDEVVEEVAKE